MTQDPGSTLRTRPTLLVCVPEWRNGPSWEGFHRLNRRLACPTSRSGDGTLLSQRSTASWRISAGPFLRFQTLSLRAQASQRPGRTTVVIEADGAMMIAEKEPEPAACPSGNRSG